MDTTDRPINFSVTDAALGSGDAPVAEASSPAVTQTTQPTDEQAASNGSSSNAAPIVRRPRLADRLTWTARQRRGMSVILLVVVAVLAWRAIRDTSFISDPQPAQPARFDDLASRLDPNVATWQELAAIPSLGERRAKAIVEHRIDWQKRHPGKTAYQEPLDLAAVSGIGATMIEQMTPHLMFPTPPATQAAR